MRFVRVGKKDLAIGLFWQIEPSLKVVREQAAKLEMSAFATATLDGAAPVVSGEDKPSGLRGFLKGGSPEAGDRKLQVGYGDARDLKRHKGAISAAALVAMGSGEAANYFASFRVGKDGKGNVRYWHLAIRDGVIQPEGDRVVSEEECNALIADHEGIFGDEVVHQFHSEKEIGTFLTQFLDPNLPRQIAIKTITPKNVIYRNVALAFFLLMVVIVGGVIGMKAYRRHVASTRNQIAQQRAAMMRAREKQLKLARERKEALKQRPWRSEVLPVQFAKLCEDKTSQVPYSIGGWDLSSWTCKANGDIDSKGNVNFTYTEDYAKTPGAGYSHFPKGYTLSGLNDLSGPNDSLTAPAVTSATAVAMIPKSRTYHIYDLASSMGWKINFASPDPKAQFKTIGSDKVLLPWSKWGFIASGQFWPFIFIRQLRQIRTARVIAIQATMNSDNTINWIITGVIYVNNPNYQGT